MATMSPRQADTYSIHPQVNPPAAWMGPARYTSFEELGTDLATLPGKAMQDPLTTIADKKAKAAETAKLHRLSSVIVRAKEDLAARLGVATNAIEITIRG